MGMISLMLPPPIAYLAITMTGNYANCVGERWKKIGVRKRPVGIGELGLCLAPVLASVPIDPAPFFASQAFHNRVFVLMTFCTVCIGSSNTSAITFGEAPFAVMRRISSAY